MREFFIIQYQAIWSDWRFYLSYIFRICEGEGCACAHFENPYVINFQSPVFLGRFCMHEKLSKSCSNLHLQACMVSDFFAPRLFKDTSTYPLDRDLNYEPQLYRQNHIWALHSSTFLQVFNIKTTKLCRYIIWVQESQQEDLDTEAKIMFQSILIVTINPIQHCSSYFLKSSDHSPIADWSVL